MEQAPFTAGIQAGDAVALSTTAPSTGDCWRGNSAIGGGISEGSGSGLSSRHTAAPAAIAVANPMSRPMKPKSLRIGGIIARFKGSVLNALSDRV